MENSLNSYDQLKKLEEVKKLVEDNIQATKQLQQSVKKIRRFIFWSQIFTWIKGIIIVLAIVGGYVYLSPTIYKFWQSYSQIIQGLTGTRLDSNSVTNPELNKIQDLLLQYKNKLK